MKIKFWGVRGSIPSSLSTFEVEEKIKKLFLQYQNAILPQIVKLLKKGNCSLEDISKYAISSLNEFLKKAPMSLKGTYGGNTSCVEVRTKDGQIILIDAGSGIRKCGLLLLHEEFGKGRGHATVLISHTHFDHIDGWPFFAPAYIPGNKFDIYGPAHIEDGKSLKDVFEEHMDFSYFPVYLRQLGSEINFNDIGKETICMGKVKIFSHPLNHTCMTLGYKIKDGKKTLTYHTDTEPYYNPISEDDEEVNKLVEQRNRDIVEHAMGSDVLICDAQYTPEEYDPRKVGGTGAGKIGWGHSTYEQALDRAKLAQVKKVIFFHYDPAHSDEKLEDNLKKAKEYARKINFKGDILLSWEGMELEI